MAEAGGRLYLAKDSRQSAKIFAKGYLRFQNLDELHVWDEGHWLDFSSDLRNRLWPKMGWRSPSLSAMSSPG